MFDGLAKEQRPSQIAALLRRRPAHEKAEAALAELKQRFAEVHSKIRQLNGERSQGGNVAETERFLRNLTTELGQIGDRISVMRREIFGLRIKHAIALREALTPAIVAAADRAFLALTEAQSALSIIEEANAELAAAHGDPIVLPSDRARLLEALARLSGRE